MDLLLLSNGNVQFKDFAIGMSADAVIEILTFKELDYSRHSNDHKPGYNLIVPNYVQLRNRSTHYDLILSINNTERLIGFDFSKSNCSNFIGKFAYKELNMYLDEFLNGAIGGFWDKHAVSNDEGFVNRSLDNGVTSIWIYYNKFETGVDVSLAFWTDVEEINTVLDAKKIVFQLLSSSHSKQEVTSRQPRFVRKVLVAFIFVLVALVSLVFTYSAGYTNAKWKVSHSIRAVDEGDYYISDSPGSKRYHKDRNCPALKRTTGKITRTDETNAIDQGKTLCGWCGKK